MASGPDDRLLVLHALRLKGFAEAAVVAAATGIDEAVVDAELKLLAADDLVIHREGRLTGWALTPGGRAAHHDAITGQLAEVGGHEAVDAGYRAFKALNQEMLTICTAWQMKDETTLNDHSDAAYDGSVLDRLDAVHSRLQPVLDGLEAVLDRYLGYRPRFAAAITRARAGELEYVTKPIIDSYHTVWFELHEDLLDTLGLDRAKEEP